MTVPREAMKEVTSRRWPVMSDILQGSVLEPVLLNTFINNLAEGIKCSLRQITGNTKLGKSVDQMKDNRALQRDLDWEDGSLG